MIKIPLSKPYITDVDQRAVMEVLESSQLSLGPKLEEFEHQFATFVGARYAVAVNSGTSALHLCVKALNITRGDQVITSPFSFISSANCLLYENATPVFVDIDPQTLNIDPTKIVEKITPKIRALLPVHIFGLPCDMSQIKSIAAHFHLHIIEDACEAIGAQCWMPQSSVPEHTQHNVEWRPVGALGQCGAFAFYPNKQMTTGEGGMVVANDASIANTCRSLRNQGRALNSQWLSHDQLGYNYRLSELHCALGLSQLRRLPAILAKRARVANWYTERLRHLSEIIVPLQSPNYRRSWFVYVIRLQDEFSAHDRDALMAKLIEQGIECRSYFPPIHLQPFYVKQFRFKRGDFPITEQISERTIALPFFTDMTETQVDYVCEVLKRLLRKAYSSVSIPNVKERPKIIQKNTVQ